MNFKTTLILLLLAVALGSYVAWDRMSGSNKEKVETTADSKKLFDVKNKDDVTSLTGSPVAVRRTTRVIMRWSTHCGR